MVATAPATRDMPPASTVQDGEPLNDAEQAQLDQIQQNFDTDAQEPSVPRLHRFNGPITYALVGESEQSIDNHARMEGDKQHTADLNKEGNIARRVIRNLWKGTLFGGYYGEKRYRDKKEEIIESNNSFVHSIDESVMGATRRATLKRFIKAEQEYRHSDETRNVLDADSEFATGIKSLVREYVQEGLDDETLQQKRQEFLDTYRENNGTDEIGEGLVEMDNLVAIAKNVRAMVEQEQSIDFVLDNMQFVVGEANTGTRTEAKYDRTNKLAKKLFDSKIGKFIPPEILAGATSVAAVAASSGLNAITKTLTFGTVAAGSGFLVGIRERKRLTDERLQHNREMALGYKIDHGSKRREELEGFRYSTESATKLTQDLYDKFDKDVLDNNQKEDLEAAIHALTVAKVRSDYSDLHNVDLISYSSEAQKEAEFYKLKDAILLMQVELGKKLRDGGAELLGVPGATLQSVVSEKAAELTQLIHQDVTGKDEAFHKYRRKKALKKGAIAVGVGAGVGMLAQEAVTALPGGRVGLAEQIFNGDELAEGGEQTKTFLNGIITGGDVHTGASEQFTAYNFGEHGSIKITDDHTIVKNPDGTMNLVDKNGNVSIENVPVESDGKLSPDSIKLLEDNGMEVKGGVHTQEVAKEIPMQEYLAKNPEELREFDNVSLYDNDTPSIFDLNEQGGRLSYNPDGTVNIGQNMTPDGSFNSGGSIDMAKGPNVFDIAIKQPDGTHLHKIFEYGQPIDKPWSDMLYQKSDGTWGYKGDGYIAWGQANGEQLHVAASIAGDNQPLPPFEEKISVEYPHYEITSSGYDTNVNIDAPPIIPVAYRSPLETLSRRNRNGLTNPDISPFYYGGGSLERMRDWIGSNPDMLRTRNRVTGPDGKQQWLEADGTAVERNVGRERDTIKKYLDHESATNPEHFRMMEQVAASLGEMDDANRVSINVPAWMEGRSLEHFLGEYVQQTDKRGDVLDPNLYEINILINRETGAVPDDSVEVIEKFIADFERTNGERPNIRYADVELDTGYNNVGYARKLLTDATMLRSLRRQDQAESLYIESEDADMISIDKRTVVNLMTKLDENPELDAVRGVQDRSPEHMKENDMLFLRRRAWDFFEIMARSKQFRNPTSPRWNFTFNRTVTGGWNTGYSAEAYVLIGGYEVVQAGEDMSIGEKMTMIRGNGDVPNLDVVGTVSSRSNSSPRRFINEIAKQKDAYADFTNPEDNKDIRQKSLDELLDSIKDYERINDSNKKEFEHYIASTYEWAKSATPTEQDAKQFEKRLLFWLGFKQGDYEIEDGSVKVKSWDNVKSSLDSYRNRYSS